MAWDRVNFGRILRDLRTEAGLTQEQLAERMGGRDRRRIMVLEQGTAVREPQLSEINLIVRALGIPAAADRLRVALDSESGDAEEDRETAREAMRTDLARRFNELLQQLDTAQQTARDLARSSDESLFEDHITLIDLYRTSRPVADAWGDIQGHLIAARVELLNQLKRERSRLGRLLPKSAQDDPVATFRERLLRYSWRCEHGGGSSALTPIDERDAVERAIDVVELGTYHLHPRVSHFAMTTMRALRYLFLMWTGLAAEAERRYFMGPPKAPRKVYDERTNEEEKRATEARDHLTEALEIAQDTPIPDYTRELLAKEWTAHERENIEGYRRLFHELNELFGKLGKEAMDSLPGHRVVDLGGRGTRLL